jgi:diguanylate cyclase (GGDEF)-like protein
MNNREQEEFNLLKVIEEIGALSKEAGFSGLKVRVLTFLQDLLQAESVSLFLPRETTDSLAVDAFRSSIDSGFGSRGFRLGEGPVGRAMSRRETLIQSISGISLSPELSGETFSALCLPLVGEDRAFGVVEIIRRESLPFSSEEVALGRTLVRLLSLEMETETLRLATERDQKFLEQKEFDLYSLYQISKTLSSVLDLDELNDLICDMVAEMLNTRSCFLFLMNDDSDKLELRGAKLLDRIKYDQKIEINLGEGLTEWIGQLRGESMVVSDFTTPAIDSAFPGVAGIFSQLDVRVCTPLLYKSRLVGLLALGDKFTDLEFSSRDGEFISTFSPLAANAVSNAFLYQMAIMDATTRLYMARYFKQRCQEEIKRARRYGKPLSLLMLDLDYFKRVNDTYGHLVGDMVLKEVGGIIKKSCRVDVDIPARYGGEEFVVLSPETPKQGAQVLAERIRSAVAEFSFAGQDINLTISGGIATFPEDASDYTELVERADTQLYQAKKEGRNRICLASAAPDSPQPVK